MSQHGTMPSGSHFPGPGGPSTVPFAWAVALRFLVRETALGVALWACVPGLSRAADLGVGLAGLASAILYAYWFGLLRPRSWAKTLTEGTLLWSGSICFANLLLAVLGVAPWAARAP